MNDLDSALHDVFRERARVSEPDALRQEVLAIPHSPPRPSGSMPTIAAWSFQDVFSATKFIVAGVFLALVGGVLISGAVFGPSEDDELTAAVANPSQPIPSTANPTSSASSLSAPSPHASDETPRPCPEAWDPPDRNISWETASASLQADSIEMRDGDCVFTGVGSIVRLHSDPGDQVSRTLEVRFEEQGVPGGMYVYFGADETHWWVKSLASTAGIPIIDLAEPASIATENGQLFKTPRGETFVGDIRIPTTATREPGDITGEIVIKGLRLTAFAPGTGPVALTGCRHVPQAKRRDVRRRLDKAGIMEMTPVKAEAALRDRGLCFTFRYDYPFPPESEEGGYSERWCTAPPRGRVGDLGYLPDGEVLVFVGDRKFRERRAQPPEGWNCPSDAPTGPTASAEPSEGP